MGLEREFDTRRTISRIRVISILGLTTATVVSGFLIWRATRGEWPQVALDALIVATLLAIVWLAAVKREARRAGTLMCIFNCFFCILAASLIGPGATGWIYVALVSNFFIASARVAAWCSGGLVLAATALMAWLHADAHVVSTFITWSLVCGFTHTFARYVQVDAGNLEEMATIDALTQVPNRRAMEEYLQQMIHGGRAAKRGLLVIDLDKFKLVNDTYGHAAGDRVLAAVAAALKDELRRDDRVFRFGGEEFVVVLPTLAAAVLTATGERLRASIEAFVESPGGPITVSVGGACYAGEFDWQTWFSRADEALYRAKGMGGNVVVCTVPGGEETSRGAQA